MPFHSRSTAAFTLIELSVVLVIIGLIVGGILVGRDLIDAAGVRAEILQIEKFQQAVNTFKGKYGQLPGDICDPEASNFGFIARGTYPGQGNGNGILEANPANSAIQYGGGFATGGEIPTFWVDLSTAHLIENGIAYLGPNYPNPYSSPLVNISSISSPSINQWLPAAKIGQGNYVYVYSANGTNYYAMSANIVLGWANISTPALTVKQASALDTKVDDGLPQSGHVIAQYQNYNITHYVPIWAAGGGVAGASPGASASPSATTCYDNGGSASKPMQYSLGQNYGSGMNCAVAIQFQ